MNDTIIVYKAVFPNGKCYIGQSRDFAERKKVHAKDKHCIALYNAIKQHGKPAYEVMASFDNQLSANTYEMFFIAYHKAKDDCYNIRHGSSKGRGRHSEATKRKIGLANRGKKMPPFTAEHRRKLSLANSRRKHNDATKRKMSLSAMGNQNCLGRVISDETRLKISQSRKGIKYSDETRRKMSLAKKGKPAHNKGKPMSEEQKRKLSLAKKGKPSPIKGKKKSPQARMNMSNAQKGNTNRLGKTGHKLSKQTRERMSKAAKKRWAKSKEGEQC